MHTVVLFCGKAGSGKDTCFQMLKTQLKKDDAFDLSNHAFGKPLKEIVSDVCQLFLNERFSVGDMEHLAYKEIERPEHTVFTQDRQPKPLILRTLLQQIGTDILRKQLGQDVFAKAIIGKIEHDLRGSTLLGKKHVSFITDLRFPNEQKCIQDFCHVNGYKCITIYICRNGSTLSSHSHISESYYDELHKDIIIQNDGTLNDLEKELLKVINKL
jgi:hypothetical protein